MATINLNQPTKSSGNGTERPVLPGDSYRMKIIDAKMEDDTFAKPDRDGVLPEKVVLTFEITALTEVQQEAAEEAEEDWSEIRIWHRFNPFYGDVKAGGPSKFKAFIDNLVEWGLLTIPNPDAFDIESLVGIELRCLVSCEPKKMGPNAGKLGNKITGFSAVRAKGKGKNKPEPASVEIDEDDRPVAAPQDNF